MFSISFSSDAPITGAFSHLLADIPGGVTLSSEVLGGAYLKAGTPIGKDTAGRYAVCKTAQLSAQATSAATSLQVRKGHHFLPGDYIASDSSNGKKIKSIDKSNPAYDLLVLQEAISVELSKNTPLFASKGEDKIPKVTPSALVSATLIVPQRSNLFCAATLIGVVREELIPPIPESFKEHLRGIFFI
ncbi:MULTISPECIES: hypothetical protein [unclassified Capnocytophaga]|uniref:hypothetical protein n=1 Tax=unclassified Capnocytophaga TaxID=2640652 RepID=UPI000202ED19|nr:MULTISPECIES: hypothetical protein [unclassified Capnocytophaga]EGD34918.1 hypothetical protein HMPREF9071_0610 [Capnocytophaga sp. oral taxon 338 str. F0234]MEB3004649.1 hypothetical protein [Capnocytophaga sp. G2]